MITLFELRELAREKCLDDPIDLCTLLWVWTERDSGGDLAAVLENTGIDLESMRAALMSIEEGPSEAETEILKELLVSEIDGPVHGGHILKKICECPDNRAIEALEDAGLDCEALLKNVRRHVSNKGTLAAAGIEVAEKKENPLLAYGRDLTAEAEQGEFDALCDRPAELDRMFEVLLRKQKGNMALTGPAGVGKSGLVELFARCVARGDVPQALGNVRVFEVNMGKLVAGTKYRGDFEERMETVIAAVQDRDPAILFVDEMHMLWGAGRAEGIVTDAANMLKPVLGRGGLRFIGATTSEEYRKYIARDAALARRFQEVRLSEPDDELTEKMVLAQADSLAAHHRIGIHPDVARKAVELTNQHVINRFQPDKSVDLLDSACVHAGRDGRSELNVPDLLHVLSRQTGRPISNLTGDDRATLRNLAASLKRAIVGQDAAIDRIVGLLVHRRQGFVATERPLASMLFCGRTGIGKTETAMQIAEMFFGEKKRLLHLDLAEFNQEMSVNKLIGSPPGYSGSDEEGVLSRFLQTAGSGVILLDEIEKAHPDIHKRETVRFAFIWRTLFTKPAGLKSDHAGSDNVSLH